ncbi:MAG: alcohol dehydrogenase catalytic domain-containing protein [Pseudomonadota bacterium]
MPGLMKAIRFHGPRDLRFERVPRPGTPEEDEVLIQVKAAGICGSDLHVSQTGAYVTLIPVVMGHEFSGTVLETGSKALGFSRGDHVVGDSRVFCGQCDSCEKGRPNLCRRLGFIGEVKNGAFGEEIVLPASSLVKVEKPAPFHLTALAEPLAVALHAFRQARVQGRPRTLILGAGPIGALIHQVALLEGLSDISITDASAFRRQALETARPGSVGEPSGRYELVFETTGSAAVLKNVIPEVVEKKGTLVTVGLFHQPVEFDFNLIVENEWSVFGCAAFNDELPAAVRLLEQHHFQFEHVVSRRLPLREFGTAFATLLSPEKKDMKVIFEPELE